VRCRPSSPRPIPCRTPVRLAYQLPVSSTFLSQQISHQQPASSTLVSEQTSTSHQPPANRTGSKIGTRIAQAAIGSWKNGRCFRVGSPPPIGTHEIHRSQASMSHACQHVHRHRASFRVHLTVGNRSGYRDNRSYRSSSVRKKLGYRSLTEPSKP
jgi:hypothetical protein